MANYFAMRITQFLLVTILMTTSSRTDREAATYVTESVILVVGDERAVLPFSWNNTIRNVIIHRYGKSSNYNSKPPTRTTPGYDVDVTTDGQLHVLIEKVAFHHAVVYWSEFTVGGALGKLVNVTVVQRVICQVHKSERTCSVRYAGYAEDPKCQLIGGKATDPYVCASVVYDIDGKRKRAVCQVTLEESYTRCELTFNLSHSTYHDECVFQSFTQATAVSSAADGDSLVEVKDSLNQIQRIMAFILAAVAIIFITYADQIVVKVWNNWRAICRCFVEMCHLLRHRVQGTGPANGQNADNDGQAIAEQLSMLSASAVKDALSVEVQDSNVN